MTLFTKLLITAWCVQLYRYMLSDVQDLKLPTWRWRMMLVESVLIPFVLGAVWWLAE